MADAASKAPSSPLKRWAPLIVIVGLAALVFAMGWHRYLSLEAISDNREALKSAVADAYVQTILIYMAVYAVAVALSLPGGAVLTVLGGFLFGPVWGGAITVVAASIGAVVIFLVARTSLGEPLAARAGPWLDRLRGGFQDNALSYLLFLRLVPVFPFWLVNLAPAFLGVPVRTYVIGTVIGIIPGTYAFTFVGAGLDSIIAEQRAVYQDCLASGAHDCSFSLDTSAIVTPELLLAFGALGLVSLLPVAFKRWRKTKGNANG